MKINIEHYDRKVEIILDEDLSYDEVLESFKGAMIVIGFSEKTVFDNIEKE